MASARNDARLSFRLPSELKQLIEEAAAHTGQTVRDFTVSTLIENARRVIGEHNCTVLSRRDRDLFIKLIDDSAAKPNTTLVAAAEEYKRWRAES